MVTDQDTYSAKESDTSTITKLNSAVRWKNSKELTTCKKATIKSGSLLYLINLDILYL